MTSEWTQARCANAALAAFRIIEINPNMDTTPFLAVAQLLHLAATRTSADMDRACAIAVAAEDIVAVSKPYRKPSSRETIMRAHRLKIWPEQFVQVTAEHKKCEVRRADRDFRVGDFLLLWEFDPIKDQNTGRCDVRMISHIHRPADVPRGLVEGFVVLSLEHATVLEQKTLLGEACGVINGGVEWIQPTP